MDVGLRREAARALVARYRRSDPPPLVVVEGRGGTGKTGVLEAAVAAVADARPTLQLRGLPFARLAPPTGLAAPGPGTLVVADDAQWLDEATIALLVAGAETTGGHGRGLVLSARPTRLRPALAHLVERAARDDALIRLGALSESELAAGLAGRLGAPPDPSLIEAVAAASGGGPLWARVLVEAWVAAGIVARGRLVGPADVDVAATSGVLAGRLGQLTPEERVTLAALVAAPGPAVAHWLAVRRPEAHAALVDWGLVADGGPGLGGGGAGLGATGAVPPLVAAGVRHLLEAGERAQGEELAAAAGAASGMGAEVRAEHLWRARSTAASTADAYRAAGDRLILARPGAAAEWYSRAIVLDPADTASRLRRVHALLVAADGRGALHEAESLLADERVGASALAATAAVFAARGLWLDAAARLEAAAARVEAATQCTGLPTHTNGDASAHPGPGPSAPNGPGFPGPPGSGPVDHPGGTATVLAPSGLGSWWRAQAALCRALSGDVGQARRTPAVPATADAATTLVGRVTAAVVASAGAGPTDVDATRRALQEVVALAPEVVLPADAVVSVEEAAAAVALVSGDPLTARRLLTGARLTGLRRSAATRLAAWLELRLGESRAVAPEDTSGEAADRGPAELVDVALEAAAARRSGDVARGTAAARRLGPALAASSVDVTTFDPAAELIVLARRYGSSALAADLEARLEAFLVGLGRPPLWAARFHWARLEAAAATRQQPELEASARALAELAASLPSLVPQAEAAAVWAEVMSGRPDPGRVEAAVAALRDIGLALEASQLAGQAAIRVTDAGMAKSLLGRARALRGEAGGAQEGEPRPLTRAGLSEREVEVGRLVLDGLTHRDIGATLYISSKTVEHHVAHIRTKLGATNRAAFLASLREDLAAELD